MGKPYIISMPKDIMAFNGSSTRCDTLNGPCSCGAWHSKDDILNKLSNKFGLTKADFESLLL